MVLTNAKPYSPMALLSAILAIGANEVTVNDISKFPNPPFYAVITGDDNANHISESAADYETILVREVNSGESKLLNIERKIEGTEQEWSIGSYIGNLFTAQAYEDMRAKIFDITKIEDIDTFKTMEITGYKQENGHFIIEYEEVI